MQLGETLTTPEGCTRRAAAKKDAYAAMRDAYGFEVKKEYQVRPF